MKCLLHLAWVQAFRPELFPVTNTKLNWSFYLLPIPLPPTNSICPSCVPYLNRMVSLSHFAAQARKMAADCPEVLHTRVDQSCPLGFFVAFKSFFSSGHLSCLDYNRNLLIGLEGLNCCPGAYLTSVRLWTCLYSWALASFPADGIKGTLALHWLPGALWPTPETLSFVGYKFWYPFSGSQLGTHLISEPWPRRKSELDLFFPRHAPAPTSTVFFFFFSVN